ncbi:MAG: hypothetical protein JWO38_4408 [Gemmataceae bacterium]|nr:hypothetical protein [Gemmataceae bacterium]
MTEEEWGARELLFGPPPLSPLSWLRDPVGDRRMFLFLAAYLPRLMLGRFCPACVEMLPLFSQHGEGKVATEDWVAARREHDLRSRGQDDCATRRVFRATIQYLRSFFCPAEFWDRLFQTHTEVSFRLRQKDPGDPNANGEWMTDPETVAVSREGMRLLRDIGGNPFRPVAFDPSWRTDTAATLARQMYESREFSAMPILADALQDAGCDNEDILGHCRGDGPHVRGCHVIDLLLGKE